MTRRRVLALGALMVALFSTPSTAQVVPRWTCSLDNVGATLTQCQAAPGAGTRLYITDVVAQSTTATAGQFLVRAGTGAACGTGTVSILPASAAVVRLAAPANTSAPLVLALVTPIVAPYASAVCVLGVLTNTTTIELSGFIGS